MRNNTKNRFISGLLASVMMLNQVPVFAAAEETGLCEHHTVHEDCGYVESVISCGFKCDVCIQKQGETTTPTVDASMPINGTDESELLMQEKQKEIPPEEISIPETLCIGVNQVNTIRPEFTPLNATTVLRCESSNPEIVACHLAGIGYSVNVTGKSPGTGIITIYTDNGKFASCSVTVLSTSEPIEISIPQYCQIQLGQSYHIPITLLPVDAETQYSIQCSDPSVVSVNTTGGNSGVVIYGANEGVAVITVETSNGLQATCEVTVESGDEVEQVIIPDSKQLVEADTWYVPITNYPETSYTRYSISCDNSSVVRVGTTGASTGCFVQAVSEGTATITISTDNGKYASCLITVVHDFSEEIVYVDPTCTNSGGLAKKCTICGKLIITEEYQEAFGHSEEIDAAVDATCTEPGLTEGRHCSECGEVLLAQKVIPAGHKVTDGICTMCRSYGTNGTDVTWEYQDGILTISGSGQMNSFDVIAEYPWCDIHDLVHTVIIEEGITNIPKSAFHLFQNLTSIHIPDSVTSIGETAFVYCKSLTQIQIPDSVETIGSRAFDGCTALEGVKLPAKLKTVSSELFYNCNALAYAVIPNGVTTIESGAFSRCFSLDYLYLPASVTSIAGNNSNYANNTRVFDSCSENLVILCQNSAKPNGWSRYWNYISATNALQVYYGCTSQDGDFWVLGDKTNTSLRIPEGVTVVPAKAFYDRGDLTAVFLPDSLTTIGHSAFRDCENLEEIQIPQGVKTIESNTFHSCVNLQHVVIPDSLITIEKSAFKNCKALAWIYIPENVYQIEESPFYGCDSSMNIYCGAEEKSIAWSEKWNYYQDYTPTLRTHFGYSREEASYWANLDVSQNKIEIPEGITRIPDSAFYGCSNIESITIPNAVISVGEYAFSGCTGLTSIQLPASISYIGRYAFNGCTDLYQINIPQALVDLNECVFAGCTALEEIIFPDTLETIRKHVFYNCTGLGKFTFLGDAPYIHEKAFYGVTATAYYPDSNPTWTSDMLQNNGGTITWLTYGDEHTHNYVDDVCTVCGELHPRYISLDSVEWTAKQVVDDRLYRINLNFKDASLAVGYGVNIEQFDEVSQEAFLKAYYEGDTSVILKDGIFYYVGSGDGGNITYTTSGKNVYVNCEDYIDLTFVRTREKQLTLVESNILGNPTGIILMCCEEPSVDDEHIHNYVDDICTICGELHPRYVPLDSVKWTAKQVMGETLYQMNVNFADESIGITYGDNIDQFDAELRETLLQEYYNGSPAVVLVNGAYFYVGRGDGGNITYTTNGKNVYVNCEDYINLTFKRTGEKQLTVVGSNLENLIGLVLTCCGDSTIGHEWQEATCATPKVCTICGITEGVATGNHTFDESTHQCACGAYGGKCGDDVTWMLDTEGVLTVSGTGDMWSFEVDETPWNAYIEQITQIVVEQGVQSIGDGAFRGCSVVTDITLPDGLLKIGDSSFMFCRLLREVRLPETLTNLGEQAFFQCFDLEEIYIPASVKQMGDIPFGICESLTGITVDPENQYYSSDENGYLFNKDKTVLYQVLTNISGSYTVPDSVTTINRLAFDSCTNLTEIIIPDSVTAIGKSAFGDCTGLKKIQLPSNLKRIEWGLFIRCLSLESVTIPASVKLFDNQVFADIDVNNGALSEIIFEGSAPNMPELALEGATVTAYYPAYDATWIDAIKQTYGGNITWVPDGSTAGICGDNLSWTYDVLNRTLTISGTGDMYDHVKSTDMPWYDFRDQITSVEVQSGVTSLGMYAFEECINLKEISLPDSITSIGASAFLKCTSLERVVIPGSVTEIPYGLFAECSKLEEVTLPNGITSIGEIAFANCSSLSRIDLPDSVINIGVSAFVWCDSLKEIRFLGDAPVIEADSFAGVTATAYYSAGNSTWTTSVMQNYGGSITWVPYCDNSHSFGEWITEGNNSSRTCIHCGYTEHKVVTGSGDVEIEIPEQPDLEVEVDPVLPSEDEYVLVEEVLDSTGNQNQAILKVFDINLINSDGVHVQPSGTVKVKLPLNWSKNGNYKVYRVNDDGTLTDMNAYRQGSQMVFETDHFSLYVIVEEGHSHNYQPIVTAPTCTTDGFTTYTCDGCGNSYVDDEVASSGHSYDDGVITTKPTCMAEGVKTFTCGTCGNPKTEPVPKDPKNHSFTKYESDKNATCKKDGTKTAKCDYGCGKTDTVTDKGSKLGHNYVDGKCTRCGLTQWIPDTGDKIMIAITVLVISGSALLVLLFLKKRT